MTSLQLTTEPPRMAVSTVKVEPSIAASGVGADLADEQKHAAEARKAAASGPLRPIRQV